MRYKKFAAAVMAAGFLLSGGVFLGGCGSSQQAAGQKQAIKVTTFKPFKSDTPIMREYTGSIMALQEVPVRAKVSGTVMEKYITGGQQVTEGQPLYRLDTRNYNSQLANAQAQAAQQLLIMRMRPLTLHATISSLLPVLFLRKYMIIRRQQPMLTKEPWMLPRPRWILLPQT